MPALQFDRELAVGTCGNGVGEVRVECADQCERVGDIRRQEASGFDGCGDADERRRGGPTVNPCERPEAEESSAAAAVWCDGDFDLAVAVDRADGRRVLRDSTRKHLQEVE